MSMHERAADYVWREQHANEVLGSYAVKTAGSLVYSNSRELIDGWIYGGADAFILIADSPEQLSRVDSQWRLDARTVYIPFSRCERPALTTKRFAPNAIARLGLEFEIAGAKKPIMNLAQSWAIWSRAN